MAPFDKAIKRIEQLLATAESFRTGVEIDASGGCSVPNESIWQFLASSLQALRHGHSSGKCLAIISAEGGVRNAE